MRDYRFNIDYLSAKKGISQAELARRIGVTPSTLSQIKTRKRISFQLIGKLMDAFELDSLDDLLQEIRYDEQK